MASRAIKGGTRRLSDVARLVVMPDGIVATGWPDVERTSARMGVAYDEWQKGCGRIILAKRADGSLATTVGGVGMSFPRQVGKTYLLAGLVFSLCANTRGLLIIWTAHHLKTSGETFLAMQAFADQPGVRPFVEKVYTGSGDEEVRFKNGSRILFGARERGFGRGIPGVDGIIFDEAQILSDRALDAMLATMNTSSVGLHIYIGTPPRPDDMSESFTDMRRKAWAGELEDAAWIECGADPGCDPLDRKQWAKANPSHPHRTPVAAFQRLLTKLKPESFLREGLGVWDDTTAGQVTAIDVQAWSACTVDGIPDDWPLAAIGLDMDPVTGRLWTSVAAHREPAGVHVEVLPADLIQDGTGAAVAWVHSRARRRRPVVIPADSPATVLQAPLIAKGCKVYVLSHRELTQACASLEAAVREVAVTHVADDLLAMSVAESSRERSRTAPGQWKFSRSGDLFAAPLYAAACAHFGAVRWSRRSATSSEGEVTVL